jgi:hypothetical protein
VIKETENMREEMKAVRMRDNSGLSHGGIF